MTLKFQNISLHKCNSSLKSLGQLPVLAIHKKQITNGRSFIRSKQLKIQRLLSLIKLISNTLQNQHSAQQNILQKNFLTELKNLIKKMSAHLKYWNTKIFLQKSSPQYSDDTKGVSRTS